MVLIPAGSFTMGDNLDGSSTALPLHTVDVSAIYMDQYEVTKTRWDEVYSWAITNGYIFDNVGSSKSSTHPVHTVSWYDCVKWCNARSEKEGRTPAYLIGRTCIERDRSRLLSPGTVVIACRPRRNGRKEAEVGRTANDFRAATPSPTGRRTISVPAATLTILVLRAATIQRLVGFFRIPSPVGFFAPNSYGLYDMAGTSRSGVGIGMERIPALHKQIHAVPPSARAASLRR